MAKTIVKEIIISLLLCLAIILLLGILLYDYVPMAKKQYQIQYLIQHQIMLNKN